MTAAFDRPRLERLVACASHVPAGAVLALFAALTWADTSHAQTVRDSYRLEARLDPERNQVQGRATIRWHNSSRVPLTELMFHLYANAFADEHTVFMREQGSRLRGAHLDRRGGIDLLSLSTADGTDLLVRSSTAIIDRDDTQMRARLPRPLAPGESMQLETTFRVRLPSIVARMGANGDFFMLAQWFPKLAKLETDGSWASFPYHGLGEFYTDYADYDLRVQVPARYVVAAPGRLSAHSVQPDGTRIERYVLPAALDVAWAAYPRFRRVSARSSRVEVEVFVPPGHTAFARTRAQLLLEQLRRLGTRLGPYPYERLVVVLPPSAGEGAAGMEYPGLIVGWTASWHTECNPIAGIAHDSVASHELAHQWFPMLVASNEVEAPVLDEGLAEWLMLDLLRERYGPKFWQRVVGLPLDLFDLAHARFVTVPRPPSSLNPAYAYHPDDLAPAVYLRPALALETIRRTWGRARLDATLSRYAHSQRYRHPRLDDLWAAFDQGYWPGFSQHVLRPALEGKAIERRRSTDSFRRNLLESFVPSPRRAAFAMQPPLLARLLLWAQTALAVLAP